MKLLRKLWNDESGVILSAEAAVVGTVAVVGLGTGLTVVSTAVNDELRELGYALRSLDQSYTIPAQEGCGASTAGSQFVQQDIATSLEELRTVEHEAEVKAKAQSERLQERVREQRRQQRERQRQRRQEQESTNDA